MPVLSQHEDSQVRQRLQVADGVDAVVVEIEEDEGEGRLQVLDTLDQIVLQAEEAQRRFVVQNRNALKRKSLLILSDISRYELHLQLAKMPLAHFCKLLNKMS